MKKCDNCKWRLKFNKEEEKATKETLYAHLKGELDLISEAWPDHTIDISEELAEPSVIKLEGYTQIRMLATGDYKNLESSLMKDVEIFGIPPTQVKMIRNFFTMIEPGEPMGADILSVIIRHIHDIKKEAITKEI